MNPTFICVECEQQLPAEERAYDTDPEHNLGVCAGCDEAIQEADAIPAAWREVA